MIAEFPVKGGSSVTPAPWQSNLIPAGLTMTEVHGSAAVPAPRYEYPPDPAGFPSPFQPVAGRVTNIGGEPPPVSKISSVAPSMRGSPLGRSNEPTIGFATIFACDAGCTT